MRCETISISKTGLLLAVKGSRIVATDFQLKGKMVSTFALEINIRERNFGVRRRDCIDKRMYLNSSIDTL